MSKEEIREILKKSIKISSSNTSQNTGSVYKDFYVYEWIIEDTGEVFYVGKGRGKRATAYHDNNLYVEKL